MSGICDTCRRDACRVRTDGLESCGFHVGESNYERLFGTPEEAADEWNALPRVSERDELVRDMLRLLKLSRDLPAIVSGIEIPEQRIKELGIEVDE